MNFKECRRLIYEDFKKVLTQKTDGGIKEWLYIERYLITNNSFKYCFGLGWEVGQRVKSYCFLYMSLHGGCIGTIRLNSEYKCHYALPLKVD